MPDVHFVEERRDPIPPGWYWVDVVAMDFDGFYARLQAFSRWLRSHPDTLRLGREEDTERQAAPGVSQGFHRWILFEVTAPTPRWPAEAKLGVPTVAHRGSETRLSDTERERPKGEGEWSWPELSGMFAGGGLGVLLLLYFLMKDD